MAVASLAYFPACMAAEPWAERGAQHVGGLAERGRGGGRQPDGEQRCASAPTRQYAARDAPGLGRSSLGWGCFFGPCSLPLTAVERHDPIRLHRGERFDDTVRPLDHDLVNACIVSEAEVHATIAGTQVAPITPCTSP